MEKQGYNIDSSSMYYIIYSLVPHKYKYVLKYDKSQGTSDEMNVVLLLDEVMIKIAKRFESHRNVLDAKYFTVNKHMYLPPTLVVNISNYIITDEQQDENCPVYKELKAM